MPDGQFDQQPEKPARPTDAAGNPIYRIPEGNVPALVARIEKMNKRARKLGMEPLVTFECGEEFESRKRRVPNEFINGAPKYIEYQVRFILCTVVGLCPKVNGWQFVATIQHEGEGGNILRVAPGFEETLPLAYRTAGTVCEHCSTNRRRNDTYILKSDTDGWKQVGRNCLADFLRTESPAGLAEWAEVIASLSEDMGSFEDEGMGGGGHGETYFSMQGLLAQVSCCVGHDGWCSRGEARTSYVPKFASVDQALNWFDTKFVSKQTSAAVTKYTPSTADWQAASAAVAWAQELPADVSNDYLWNLRVASFKERITHRTAGLVGSLIVAHAKHLERELARKYETEHSLDEYFGTVGKREVFTLTITGTRDIESDWGSTTLVKFRDQDGRPGTWFASNFGWLKADGSYYGTGDTITVKASVKAHELYNGRKQTALTRVALHVEKEKTPRKKKLAGTAIHQEIDTILAEANV